MNLQCWSDVKVLKDEKEHVTKFIFTKEDAVVETVLYRYPTYLERTVICHSVMSGCPMGCRFCGTGNFFIRNLTTEEMLEQVEYALVYACLQENLDSPDIIKKLQIMSMSMGEPMLNKDIAKVYRRLHHWYHNAALLMSTSAPDVDYSWFFGLAKDIPTVGMQFSVHESTDLARNKLIPFEKKLTLEQIAQRGREFYHVTGGRKPFFNYCAGWNNSTIEDAYRLRDLFNPSVWEVTVSVICEQDKGLPATNDKQRGLAEIFSSFLVNLGFNVRVFDPAGQDTIGGGCGQLWHVQEWVKNNQHLAKPSIGFGREQVHTPTMGGN